MKLTELCQVIQDVSNITVTLLTSALCQSASATGRSQLDQAGGADLWRQSRQACYQLAYAGHGDEGQGPERRKKA